MKTIVKRNPFVKGGESVYTVVRETKTQYVCQTGIRFRKPDNECDGCLVREIGADRWDDWSKLRIKED